MEPLESIGRAFADPLTFLVLAYGLGVVICGVGVALLEPACRLGRMVMRTR